MKEKNAFFAVAHKYMRDPEWLAEPFTKGQAWVDLIGNAAFVDNDITKRGELIISERGLAKRWKWSESKVRRYLQKLEKEGRIRRSSNRSGNRSTWGSTLTIEKYEDYQISRSSNRSSNRSDERHLYNNKNNINNNLSLMSDEETDELLQSFSPEALTDLTMDVREYYENNPDKTFPGWIKAIKQFDRNQKRWGKTTKKQSSTDRAFEAFKAEIEAEEKR